MTFARTKIQPPRPRPSFVERGAVQARLAEALRTRRLVLLCAPAGYGKTTLLAQELARLPRGSALAWVSVDAGDDVQRLLECMLAALEPYDPPWRTAPESLVNRAAGAADEQRLLVAEVVNTLAACEVSHGVIVFDDVHRVDDAGFFRFLDGLIERLPTRWCVVLTSRVDPAMTLGRLRAADEVCEFRQLHLQFARDEARALAAGLGFERSVADRLFDRTQGWPAGMRIAIGALQGAPRTDGAVERALRASERPLFEFLVTEVLEQVPVDLREFLLAVSVLPELDARRCAAVSGRSDSAAQLDAIERLGLFVDVLDAPVHTLRLHDLFREALQERLHWRDPGAFAEARRRAAATESDPIRRIALLLEAGEHDEAARLAYEHLPQLIVTAGAGSALHLVSRFPAEMRERAPELAFVRGLASWAQFWDFPAMLALMQRAADEFGKRGEAERHQVARAYVATALIALGRLDEGEAVLRDLRAQPLTWPAQCIVLNAEAWVAIDACRYEQVAPLMSRLLDLLALCERVDFWYQTTPALRMPGLPGMTAVLERHADRLVRVAGETPTPLRTIAAQTHAWCTLWRGAVGDARERMASAVADAQWTGQTGAVRAHRLTFAAVLAAIVRDGQAAMAAAEQRWQAFSPGASPWHRYILSLFAARIAAACDDLAGLKRALQRIHANRPSDDALTAAALARAQPLEATLAAQQAWLEGRVADAIGGWRAALDAGDGIDWMGQASEVRVRLARALIRQGERREAALVLAPAFERARLDGPGGVLLASAALRELADTDWDRSVPASDAAELRRWSQAVEAEVGGARAAASAASAVQDGARAPTASQARSEADQAAPRWPSPDGLTARELAVLERIAAGDSNKLIARAFDLSVHTVKRHVANILGKLNLQTRGQAAAWYRARAH